MWHEARRREKATQKLFKDHKKRAEKRREENRIDPNSLLQINGLKSELHLEPSIYKQAAKSLVPWQGDSSVTIDRFDVRATLSAIPTAESSKRQRNAGKHDSTVIDADESEQMKKFLNYERYRLLIQNDLSKTSEELRLKLVAKSDFSSDAKMGKLRNNWFGTSGETSISSSYQSDNCHYQGNKPAHSYNRKNSTIGPSYNSVPPPSSLDSRSNNNILECNNVDDPSNRVSDDLRLLESEEYDNFELDNVNHILKQCIDEKKLNDAAKKFGLSVDELIFMVERDEKDVGVNETLKALAKLNKKRESREINMSHKDQVYGPALPPELVKLDEPLESSDDSSPVQQRSPSGADIPLRNKQSDKAESSPEPEISRNSSLSKNIPSEDHNLSHLNKAAQSDIVTSPVAEINAAKIEKIFKGESNLEDTNSKTESNIIEAKDVPRRASTPLAYKRNCRSDRSVSRDRRSSRRRSTDRKRRRYRSRSSSSSHSYTSYTSSSHSSNYRAERTSRRKRTTRSRRRRYQND